MGIGRPTEHFQALNGLRGVAALLVVLFHAGSVIGPVKPVPAGYIAVDFFFILSGFVISHAYDDRLRAGLPLRIFALIRLIRLYPLMWFGIMLGFLLTIQFRVTVAPAWLVLPEILLIPTFVTGKFYPFDGVQWTLTLELALNIAHAALHRRLNGARLAIVVAILGCLLLLTAWHFHTLNVGWSSKTWWGGLIRGGFGYGCGMLLYRLHVLRRLPRGAMTLPLASALLVGGALACSYIPVGKGFAAFLCVAILFPAIIIFSLETDISGCRRLARGLGELSFPLYAVHGPVLEAWAKLAPRGAHAPMMIADIVVPVALSIAVATGALFFFDRPVRAWGSRTLLRRRPVLNTGVGTGVLDMLRGKDRAEKHIVNYKPDR